VATASESPDRRIARRAPPPDGGSQPPLEARGTARARFGGASRRVGVPGAPNPARSRRPGSVRSVSGAC